MKISEGWIDFESINESLPVSEGGLALTPEGDLCSGYDDRIRQGDKLTPEECREIALFMIEEWKKWGGL